MRAVWAGKRLKKSVSYSSLLQKMDYMGCRERQVIMDIKNFYAKVEEYSDEDLRQLIAYMSGLLASRYISNVTYENDFIDVMSKCGLDLFHAEINLLDFKIVSAVYLQKAEPLFIEDIQQVLELVLRKNGFIPDLEANRMLRAFLVHSFGRNIPSMASAN